jgi:hypothetical protein
VSSSGIRRFNWRDGGLALTTPAAPPGIAESLVWSFVALLKNKATYPVQSTLQSCVHTFIEQNANDQDKAVKGLYVFAIKVGVCGHRTNDLSLFEHDLPPLPSHDMQVQEKAAKAEEKRKKQVAAQEAKAVKEKERLAREALERERVLNER